MSARGYRFLLRVLPRGFREEFADEMTTVFVDQRRRSHGAAAAVLWLHTIAEVLALSVRLRVDQLRVDARHAFRGLIRQKTFTITAVTTFALALGPLTAVAGLVINVLLDPLPGAKNLDRVVYAYVSNPDRNRHEWPWSELNFLDQRARKQGLAALGGIESTSATIGGDTPQQVLGAWASADMFDVLGIAPARGRQFTEEDAKPGAPATIILAHHFAAARFPGRDPIGETLIVDGRKTTVIGVLPKGFRFPEGEDNFWQPLIIDPATSSRGQSYLHVMGRLKDGATIAEVQQQMNAVAIDLERQYPAFNTGSRVELAPAAAQLTRNARKIVSVLGLTALAIFLLACTNIASLLVVRTAGRHVELAVRTALGASAVRLTRQLFIEHLALASIGALFSLAVAQALLRLLTLTRLVAQEQLARATLGPPAIAFLIALTAITATTLGWLASRRATKSAGVVTGTPRTQSSSRETVRLRHALVGIEVAAAVVLLVAAGLLLRSAARLLAVNPGFRTDRVITFQISLPFIDYQDVARRVAFIDHTVDRLRQIPGVVEAASGAFGPMGSIRSTRRFAIEGKPLPAAGTEPIAIDLPAGPGYASVMGLRMIDGRWISERDRADTPPVVVISESFAKQYFPGERAVGHRLHYYAARAGAPPVPSPEIVGVVSDVRQFQVAERESPQMYVPHAQRAWNFTAFFIRTAADPRAVMASLPAAMREIDRERPIEDLATLSDLVDQSTADRRALGALLSLAAAIAILISAVGVYGVTAATTAARKRELAIRAAIGATDRRLIALVVSHGVISAGVGVALGLGGGFAVSSVLKSVLYEVEARDPWTYVTAGLGLFAICAIATYLPARRAVSTNPAIALNGPA